MPTYELRLLGTPTLAVRGAVVRVSRRKAMALLAYLATVSGVQRRDGLAALLWPEADASTARGELRRRLSQVNGLLGGDAIEADRETVRLVPELDLWVDVVAFRELLAQTETHRHPPTEACPDCVPLLQEAAALYGGEFLTGFTLEDSAAFDDWQFFEAETLRDEVASALVRLTTYYTSQGDVEQGIEHARRWVAADPLAEPAHRHLMVLYGRGNRRSAALRQYEILQRMLDAELGVAPSKRTTELHERLVNGELLAGPTAVEAILEHEVREVGSCPYRGLAAFREEDAGFFYGREGFVERLVEAVTTGPLVAMIVGASGSGKSSVIYAGLIPRLREAGGWAVAGLRPGREPFHTLATALGSLVEPDLGDTERMLQARRVAEALSGGHLPLIDIVRQVGCQGRTPARLLLLVDQFEELYTLCSEGETRRRFIDVLLEATEAAAQTEEMTLLITLRADFMGRALEHRPFADALQEASQLLGPMTREELRDAIEKPAEVQGAAFEAGLVERLLDDVAEEPGHLPLLEFALTLLWERLDFGWLTHAAYEAIGRAEGALSRHADEVYAELRPEEQALCRQVFTQLVQPGEGTEDTRRVASRAEIGEEGWLLVQRLADERLVVTNRDDLSGAETVEVVHEALIGRWERLQGWMAEDRAFRTWQERMRVALRMWGETGEDEGALLRGVPLAEAEAWQRERPEELSEAEQAYIDASVALRERRERERERRRRRSIAALGVGLILALALTAFSLYSRYTSRQQAAVGLASEAKLQMQGPDQDAAVLLGLEAVERYPYTWQAERALAEIVLEYRMSGELSQRMVLSMAAIPSPDGEMFMTAANDGLLRVWDMDSAECLLTVQTHEGVAANYLQAYWSPSGDRILTVTWAEIPRIWDAETGEMLVELVGHGGLGVAWSPDGSQVLTYHSSRERAAIVWDSWSGEVLHVLPTDKESTESAAYSADGALIATSVGQIWDARTGEFLWTLDTYPDLITTDTQLRLHWAPVDSILAAGINGTARLWEGASGKQLFSLSTGYSGAVDIWWSPHGDRLLTTGEVGRGSRAMLWDASTGEYLRELPYVHEVSGLWDPWSPDGERILLVDEDDHVRIWHTDTGDELLDVQTNPSGVVASWLPDGQGFTTAGEGGKVRFWRVETAELAAVGQPGCAFEDLGCFALPPVWSPDGLLVARTYADATIRVWGVVSGEQVMEASKRNEDGEPVYMLYLAWSPDGSLIASTAWNGDVDLWDAATGEHMSAFPGHDDIGLTIAWSPDGDRLLTCSRDKRAIVWDVGTGQIVMAYAQQDPFACAWSPEGDRIVVADLWSYGGPVRVLDASTGETALTLLPDDFGYGTSAAAWSPDGTRIVTLSLDRVGRLWGTGTGKELASFAGLETGTSAEWSPDGARFQAGGYDGGIFVWDATTLEQVAFYRADGREATAAWSPDGTAIAVSYLNGDLMVYPAWQSLDDLISYARACCVQRELTLEERARYGLRMQ